MSKPKRRIGERFGVYEVMDIYRRYDGAHSKYKIRCTMCGTEKIVVYGTLVYAKDANMCLCKDAETYRMKQVAEPSLKNLCGDCKNLSTRRDGKPSLMCWKNYLGRNKTADYMTTVRTTSTTEYGRYVTQVYECNKFEEDD